MSSAVVSTSAALGRPFVFEDEADPEMGSLASASRAALDRTAPSTPLRAGLGGCPHTNLQESRVARLQSAINNQPSIIPPASVTPASRLEIRPAPETVSSGIPAIDSMTGGLPRGCLTEICGPASSGRTTLLLAALAAATRRGEFCAVVDASDALDPQSAAAAGVDLERLLWVRCGDDPPKKENSPQRHRVTEKRGNQKDGCPISRASSAQEAGTREARTSSQVAFDFDRTGGKKNGWKENASRQSEHRLEQVLRATDLLLESGGFGLIILDLGDLPQQAARRIPLTTWFRFRRAVEYKPTILLAIEQHPIAGSCSSLLLKLGSPEDQEAVGWKQTDSSRAAAAFINPGPKSGVAKEKWNESRRDGTSSTVHQTSQNVEPTHAQLLTGLDITAELVRSRLERKPARSAMAFASKTAWAG